MALQPPPPPSISPHQMNLMRIAASMAWSDGDLAQEEVALMLERFSNLFAVSPDQKQQLKEELQDYAMQNIPLGELVPKLKNEDEKLLVLRIGYEVILSSARTPEEDLINQEEAEAYRKLIALLDLPPEKVAKAEAEAKAELGNTGSIIDFMTSQLQNFFNQ